MNTIAYSVDGWIIDRIFQPILNRMVQVRSKQLCVQLCLAGATWSTLFVAYHFTIASDLDLTVAALCAVMGVWWLSYAYDNHRATEATRGTAPITRLHQVFVYLRLALVCTGCWAYLYVIWAYVVESNIISVDTIYGLGVTTAILSVEYFKACTDFPPKRDVKVPAGVLQS